MNKTSEIQEEMAIVILDFFLISTTYLKLFELLDEKGSNVWSILGKNFTSLFFLQKISQFLLILIDKTCREEYIFLKSLY